MKYTITAKSSNPDGSLITEVMYNINGTLIPQTVVHAPGSNIDTVVLGIKNMGATLVTTQQNIAGAAVVLASITLNEEFEI